MKTLAEIALETMEQQSKRKLPTHKTIEPKWKAKEREMLSRSAVDLASEKRAREIADFLMRQVSGQAN